MNNFIFTIKGKKQFDKLDDINQLRIINKLKFLKNHLNLSWVLKNLENFSPATHRLRVWNLRVILEKIDNETFKILNVWNIWDIYK